MKNTLSLSKNAIYAASFFVAVSGGVYNANAQAFFSNKQDTKAIENDDIVQLIADNIVQGETEGQIIANGNVEALHGGRKLRANKLIYDQTTGIVKAFGDVVIIEPDGTTSFAQELNVDDRLSTGIISNLATKLNDGGTLAAKTAFRQKDSRNLLSKVVYSACKVCKEKPNPTWSIRARKATQDLTQKTISYNDAVFEVKGVPIIYIPYFKHGDPSQGRQSGFLMPVPGHSSRLGYNLETPYLQIIDKYSDIIISPKVSQFVNPILSANYRRNFYSGRLQIEGSFTKEKFFLKDGEKFGDTDYRSHIFGKGLFNINQNWKWGFGAESASDDFYLFRYGIFNQYEPRGPVRTTGARLISQIYLEGIGDDYYARILAVSFQELSSPQRRILIPKVAPNIELMKVWRNTPFGGKLSLNASGLYLDRKDDYQDTARIGASLNWEKINILKNGIVIEPNLNIKSSYFNYKNQTDQFGNNIGNNSFTNSQASASIDFKYPLISQSDIGKIIIEPKLGLRAATKINDNNYISLEDAYGLENTYNSYFLANHNSLYDFWDGGSRLTLGINLGLYTKNNSSAKIFIAKQFRSDANPFMDRLSNYDKKDGDWVSQFDLKFNEKFSLNGNARFDSDGQLMRTELVSNLNIGNFKLIAKYNEVPDKSLLSSKANRELITMASYKFTDKINVFADNWHDYESGTNLNTRFGINFGDDCTDVRFFYERQAFTNRFITPSEGFKLQIAFKTLGLIDDEPFQR